MKPEDGPNLNLKCIDCGVVSSDVELGPCPYASEIDGIEDIIPLCDSCACIRARDI